MTEQEHSDQSHKEKDKDKEYIFYVDANRYTTDEKSLTGAQIKAIAGVTPTYQLFLEEQGDQPDKPISDGDSVHMQKGQHVPHLYAVPPATFGTR